jgi:hypothetical protein
MQPQDVSFWAILFPSQALYFSVDYTSSLDSTRTSSDPFKNQAPLFPWFLRVCTGQDPQTLPVSSQTHSYPYSLYQAMILSYDLQWFSHAYTSHIKDIHVNKFPSSHDQPGSEP